MPRPLIRAVVAMSLDGKIATRDRDDLQISSKADRRFLNEMRATADALVVGAATIRASDTPMRVSPRSLVKAREPLRVVVTRLCLLSPDLAVFGKGPGTLVFTTEAASPGARKAIEAVAEVRVCPGTEVTGKEVVEVLAKRGLRTIQVEGGGEVLWMFASLLDEAWVTVCPALIGGRHAPTWLDGEGFDAAGIRHPRLVTEKRVGQELFLHYRFR